MPHWPLLFFQYLIINVHCSGERASQEGEFLSNFYFCPFTVIVGSLYGLTFTYWCITSVFVLNVTSHDCET